MKKLYFPFLIIGLAGVGLFICCKKETNRYPGAPVQTPYPGILKKPIADAGADIILILPADSVDLRGTGRFSEGSITNYKWNKLSGPDPVILINSDSAVAQLKRLVEGSYEFELVVTNNYGSTGKDWMRLLVTSLPGINCVCHPEPCDGVGDPCDPWDY